MLDRKPYVYVRTDIYDTPAASLIELQPDADDVWLAFWQLVKQLNVCGIEEYADGTYAALTRDGKTYGERAASKAIASTTFYDIPPAKMHRALEVLHKCPLFDYIAYTEEERDRKNDEEWYL